MTALARATLAEQHCIFDRRHYEKVIRELLAEVDRLEDEVSNLSAQLDMAIEEKS